MTLHKSYEISHFKALPSEGEGTFEAIVSVFGNVDLQGDRVIPGAFQKTIGKWKQAGDPIPVIWSHDWGDPFAHIGYVDPNDMREVTPAKGSGRTVGGLLVRGKLDVHKPFAKQVYDLLAERRVKEFSFSYDIPPGGERRAKDGANELTEVDLIEVGPTLKGANPATVSLGTKSADPEEERRMKRRLDRAADAELMLQLAKAGWDGAAAMKSCENAADFRRIAFERDNDSDPDSAAHWALPHHSSPGAEANPQGVSAALAALNGARGGAPDLKDKDAARSHLERHQSSDEKARGDASSLIRWFNEGADGAIAWGSPGDWSQCVAVASAHMGVEDAKGFCQRRHMEATGMTTSEHAHNEEKETEADGEKAGRVIGSKAAAELKSMLNDAVDGFIAKMNGSATDEKAVDVPRIPDPKEAPPKETAEGDKADFQKGYADGSAGRPALPHGTKQYERGYADGVKDRAAVDQQEIDRLEQQLSGLEIKPRV